jgi:alpha-glucosidase
MRFWLERGVDGFRLDTVNFYFHDARLRDNGPELREENEPAVNPYEMQDHEYSKCRPENLPFLERMRALLDEYDDRTMVGEVGEGPRRALKVMEEYTSGKRLHMAYSFDMLGPKFTPEHFRSRIEGFFAAAPESCPMWAFSNHDVIRHVTRWEKVGPQDDVAKLAAAMLLAFEGTICLYQGEELGQTETDIEYHELTDPPGIRFWPDYKGRDGCRTPMVWDTSAQGGFTTGTPWLPVKAPQLARNVAAQEVPGSVLEAYRSLLAWRKTSALLDGRSTFFDVTPPLLAFRRDAGAGSVLCVFNLSDTAVTVPVKGLDALDGPSSGATLKAGKLTLAPCGWAWSRASALASAG